jgi:hypothetical protein
MDHTTFSVVHLPTSPMWFHTQCHLGLIQATGLTPSALLYKVVAMLIKANIAMNHFSLTYGVQESELRNVRAKTECKVLTGTSHGR